MWLAVVATESHRDSLFQRLKADGLDVDAEIKHGRYISLDVAETLSTFMVNDMPDWKRFFEVVGGLVREGRQGREKRAFPGCDLRRMWAFVVGGR